MFRGQKGITKSRRIKEGLKIQWPIKKDKGTNNDLQKVHRKRKTEPHEYHKKTGLLWTG